VPITSTEAAFELALPLQPHFGDQQVARVAQDFHKVFDLARAGSLQDQDEGVLPVQDSVPLDVNAELSGVGGIQVRQQHFARTWIFGRAGIGVVLVAYKVKGHRNFLSIG
jgi:hypothetical protein